MKKMEEPFPRAVSSATEPREAPSLPDNHRDWPREWKFLVFLVFIDFAKVKHKNYAVPLYSEDAVSKYRGSRGR